MNNIKAKRLLNNEGLVVYYILDHYNSTERDLLKEVVYPDYIPSKDEEILIDDNKYIMAGSVYKVDNNSLYLSLIEIKEYQEYYKRRK